MSNLNGLIRLHKWQLDEKRRAFAELQSLQERLNGEIERLDADMAQERAIAAQSELPPIGFAAYLGTMKTRRERLVASLAQVEQQIAAANEEIAEAFQTLKRYELAQADRERRMVQRLRKLETARFDEIAVARHARAAAARAE